MLAARERALERSTEALTAARQQFEDERRHRREELAADEARAAGDEERLRERRVEVDVLTAEVERKLAAAAEQEQLQLRRAAERERELLRREAALDDREAQVSARHDELVKTVQTQARAAVELDRRGREVARRERSIAAHEAQLNALWEGAESSALERAETVLASRRDDLDERETSLPARGAVGGAREWRRAGAATGRSAAGDAGPEARCGSRAAPAKFLTAPGASSPSTVPSFPDPPDEWDAYLHHLRGYADASGIFPESFEPLMTERSPTSSHWSQAARGRGSACGQLDHERRAAACAGLDPDAPAHQADELAADVEPQPGAPNAAGELRVEPEELVEDALEAPLPGCRGRGPRRRCARSRCPRRSPRRRSRPAPST